MSTEIRAEFEVEKVTGKFTRTITLLKETHHERVINGVTKIMTTRKMEPVVEEFTEGYMIYYPQKHSLFVAADDIEQLQFLGVLQDPRLVDMNSGEDVPEAYMSNKELIESKERVRSGRRRSTTGGIDAALEN